MTEKTTTNSKIDNMFKAGAHFAFNKSRRHPSVAPFIFGAKNKVEIFDLEKTSVLLESAKEFVKKAGMEGKQMLIVGGKSEARAAVRNAGELLGMPFVDGRWLGGTLTNFKEIRKRVEKFERLLSEREKGELAKYTKKERLLIDREITKLDRFFSGIVSMKDLPKIVFIVDPKREYTAVKEAEDMNIPVVSLAGSDCDVSKIKHPVIGNDSSKTSIEFFVHEIIQAYTEGKIAAPKAAPLPAPATASATHGAPISATK